MFSLRSFDQLLEADACSSRNGRSKAMDGLQESLGSVTANQKGTGRSLFESRKAREVEACSGAVISLVLFASVWPFRRCRAWGWVTVLVGS